MVTERLGKYEIRGTLGKGAMGTVYSAWDPIISRTVAIKTVRLPEASDIDAQEELARFKREAQAAGRLTHPNIVGIFDYGESDEVAYIVMEYVEGRTLKGVLDGEERMPVATVGKIMADLLAGLRYSHERGVVHRDIKPANIMIVGGDGHGSGQAKIADFGIARIESSNLTQAGTIMGTPAYMSPEQFMGQTVDARTDIYSTGVLLFQLLTGERPFEGSMATIMHKALNTVPPRPSELSVTAPVALDAVVARAMARRPDDRYADAGAFAAAVADAIEGRTPAIPDGLGDDSDSESTVVQAAARPAAAPAVQTRPVQTRPVQTRPVSATAPGSRSKAPLFAGVAVLVLAAAGAGGVWWAGLIGAPEPPNSQIAGGTSTVTPAVGGTIVAVAPPSAPDASPPAQAPTTVASTSPPPTPRADVTQVVPPATVAAGARPAGASTAPPAPTRPAQIIPATTPPSAPPPAATQTSLSPRTDLAGAPPLEPARVSPPVTAAIPTLEPRVPETRGARADSAANTKLEPAVVTPPASANIAPAIVTPPQVRSPEPQVATSPPPSQAVVPPDTQAAPAASPTVTAALVSPEALRRAVSTAVEGADCAVVRGDLTRSGTISMQGVIGSGGPTQDLLRHVREAAPTAPLDWTVAEVNGPYCGALNLIKSYTRPFGSVSGGMDIGLKDGKTDLREDDPIDIRAQVPGFSSYLQIDYFSNDGTVLHVQTAAQGTPAIAGRSSLAYVPGAVFEPFGTDLITSIASSVPLFGKGEALSDKAEPYLRQLRTALDAAIKRRAELAAGAVVVHTSPKS